jgi:hypothetical protein
VIGLGDIKTSVFIHEYSMAAQLLALSNAIVFGSLALHVVFGGVIGFCARLAVT